MAMFRPALAASLLCALAACAAQSTSYPGPASPTVVVPAGPRAPSGTIDFGPYQRGSSDAVLRRFAAVVTDRYQPGLALSTAVGDLHSQEFKCSPGKAGRGDPPSRICRRQLAAGECTHTWQTHIWADGAQLTRVRGLYDRRCAEDDGLLGGPG